MKTLKRNILRKMIERGELVAVDSYHFEDVLGESRGSATGKPVRIATSGTDCKNGFCNIFASSLTSRCGSAWINEDGTITLYVHSNCSFDFKRISPD